MSRHQNILIIAAAALVSSALILPTSGVLAQSWTTVVHNRMPVIQGSGNVVRQNRAVGAFQRVEAMGSEDVQVRVGARPSLVIAADDNILPLITTEVRAGTLKISSRGSYRMRGPIRVWLTTPSLEAFKTSGSGNVDIQGVRSGRLELMIQGSGDMQATGSTRELDLDIHGSGTARLASLNAANVSASLYGSGDATVRATGSLDARVYGSGTLRYVGTPANIRRQNFGSGRIVAAR